MQTNMRRHEVLECLTYDTPNQFIMSQDLERHNRKRFMEFPVREGERNRISQHTPTRFRVRNSTEQP